MSEQISREQARRVVEAFLEGMAAGNYGAVAALMTRDALTVFPYSPRPLEYHGADALAKGLAATVPGFMAEVALTIESFAYDPESGRAVAQYSSVGRLTDGRPYANDYVGIWDFEGSAVCRWLEYFNPLRLG
jgi:ketosteroid isomerase-like protein